MADSPTLINSFVSTLVELGGYDLSAAQRQVLLLTNAVSNGATWPVAFHSTLALKEGVTHEDVSAIRAGQLPGEPRLAALSALTRSLIEQRGHVGRRAVQAFVDAGFRRDQVLDVVATLALSVMTNYTANVAQPPLEPAFEPQAWSR
jgi:alkylhydroperoxidase family enzyme